MGSSSYTPRHGSPQRGRRGPSRLVSTVRRPVVGGALAVGMLGTVGGAVAIGDPAHVGDSTAALAAQSPTSESSAGSSGADTTADTARLAEDRRSTNVSRSASREQDRRAAAERKKEAAEKKKAEAERKAKAAKKAKAEKKRENEAKPVSERDFSSTELAAIRKDPKPYAIELMRERGWGDGEWGCLNALWVGESNWEHDATNPSSGAYGIPQSLPASKMATAGSDWKTNPITQIEWGLDYIKTSYGSPCEAKAFWNSKDPHWY